MRSPGSIVHAVLVTEPIVRQSARRLRSSRVDIRSMNEPKPGWDLNQALRMLHDGYGAEHVSRLSGYAVPFLEAQVRLAKTGRRPPG
jgi:hypothetical protein